KSRIAARLPPVCDSALRSQLKQQQPCDKRAGESGDQPLRSYAKRSGDFGMHKEHSQPNLALRVSLFGVGVKRRVVCCFIFRPMGFACANAASPPSWTLFITL